jgi:ParB-like nuclease domain
MEIKCAHTEVVDIDSIVPNPKNANKHPDNQIALLAKIMKQQGWRNPVVVSKRSGFVVKGHGRLMAAKLNGWTTIPIDRQDYASEALEYADMIADNKIAELAETDLGMVQKDVLDLGPEFDIDLLGIPAFHIGPMDFLPGTEDDQGQLDEKKMVECPNCGEQFHPK